MNRGFGFKWIFVFFVISCFTTIYAQQNKLDAAWEHIAANQFDEAEKLFQEAIAAGEDKARAYLGLSFIIQLRGNQQNAWSSFDKALQLVDDPNPYVFSAMLTLKGLLAPLPAEGQGLMKYLPDLAEKNDPTGVMRVGAQEWLGKYHEEFGDLKKSRKYNSQLKSLRNWMLIGPFENISASGFDKVFSPETEFETTVEYEGKSGIPASWFKLHKLRSDPWIDLTRYFAHLEAIYYANTFVFSPSKQTAQIRVGTSGSVKVFLNDEPVISVFDENNNDIDTYIAETELQEGWNRLLIKCGASIITRCNFLARITDEHGKALENLNFAIEKQVYFSNPGAPVKLLRNFAEVYFEEKIAANPAHFENYLLLADCYLRNDKAYEAELVLRKVLAQMPESVLIKNHLMEAYIRGEKYDEINTTRESIYAAYPDIPTVLINKYSEYIENQNIEKAEKFAARYAELMPGDEQTYIMNLTLEIQKGNFETGLQHLKTLHEKYPKSWEGAYLMALFSIRTTQNYAGAIQIYSDFLKKRRTADAYVQLGDCYLKNSDLNGFEKTFTELTEWDPAAVGIYHSLAKVFHQVQDYKKAENYVRETLKLKPGFSGHWTLLGEIKQSTNATDEAIAAYRRALHYDPTDYDARARLRELEGRKDIFNHFLAANIDSLMKNAPLAEKYPDHGAAFLLEDMKRVVYPKGASETSQEILLRVFNADGISTFQEYRLGFVPFAERLIVEKAVVIKPDGTEIKADENLNHLVFKSLEPNDFIYIKWRIRQFYSGRLAHHIWDEFNFNYFYPVEDIRYSLLIPDDFTFAHKTQNMPDTPEITRTDDGKLYVWQLKDQPAVEIESNMPTLEDIGKMLYISSIPSWEYLVEWYADLAKTKTRSTFEIQEQVAALLAEKSDATQMDKIEMVYNFITRNINYSSVSFRQSGLIPQPARKVLVQKIGDCKDVATLGIAMLKEMGIDAHYVLVNTVDEGLNRNILPAIDFNHAIVGVETDNGMIYMDLTAKNFPLKTMPHNDLNAFSLNIKAGVTEPAYIPENNFLTGITSRKSTVKLQDDDSAIISRDTHRFGASGVGMREDYATISQTESEKKIKDTLADEFPNVEIIAFKYEEESSHALDINYHYEFKVPYFLVAAGSMKLLKLPWSDNNLPFSSLASETRTYDYHIRAASDTLTETMVVELPAGYKPAEVPKPATYSCTIAEYAVTYSYKNDVLTATRKEVYLKKIVTPEEYQAYREFYNQTIRADALQILLQKI